MSYRERVTIRTIDIKLLTAIFFAISSGTKEKIYIYISIERVGLLSGKLKRSYINHYYSPLKSSSTYTTDYNSTY